MNILMQTVRTLLQKCIEDIDNGNCNLDSDELEEAVLALKKFMKKDLPMSKYQAYNYLNVSRATFDNYVREGKLPRGQKVQGYKELSWFQKDLDNFIQECKHK